jgi:hypothetical protein
VHEETQNGTGKRSSRSQKGRGSAVAAADDAAQDWGPTLGSPRQGKCLLRPQRRLLVDGWLEDLYLLHRIDLKSSDMILLPMSDA